MKIHTHSGTSSRQNKIGKYLCTYLPIYICKYIYTYVYIFMYVYMNIYVFEFMHTQIGARAPY